LRAKRVLLHIARDARRDGARFFQRIDNKDIVKAGSHGMEAALWGLEPDGKRFMDQARNRKNRTVKRRSNNLPCHEWRVDAAARIEIRRGAILGNGAAQSGYNGTGACFKRCVVGFPAGQPIRPRAGSIRPKAASTRRGHPGGNEPAQGWRFADLQNPIPG